MTEEAELDKSSGEVRVLAEVLQLLGKLAPESQRRIFHTVEAFFNLGGDSPPPRTAPQSQDRRSIVSPSETSFSEDRSPSPKQFMMEKQPRTDVERVACLAYYLTHYRGTPEFKTLDISKLNTEAAQIKFSNAAVAVENAAKMTYLASASKGNKQLSALGEQFVFALPDRDRAKAVMTSTRSRRRTRKPSQTNQALTES